MTGDFKNIATCKFDSNRYSIGVDVTEDTDKIVKDNGVTMSVQDGKISISFCFNGIPAKTSTIKVKFSIYKIGESQPVYETDEITLTINVGE